MCLLNLVIHLGELYVILCNQSMNLFPSFSGNLLNLDNLHASSTQACISHTCQCYYPHTDLIHTHFGQSVYAYLWLFQVQLFWHRRSTSATGSQGLALPMMLHFLDNRPLNIRTLRIYTEKQPNDIEPVCVLIMCLPSTNVCKSVLSLSTLTKAWQDSCLLHLLKKFWLPAQIAQS